MKKFSSLVFGLAALSLTVACASDVDDPGDDNGNGTGAAPGSGGGSNPSPGGGGGSTQPPNTGGGNGGGGGGTPITGFSVTKGYVTSGTWKGHAYTFPFGAATVTPPCGTGECFTSDLCATATIPKDYESGAGIAFAVNQEEYLEAGGDPPKMPLAISGTGVNVSVSGAPAGTRVKVDVGAKEYCADLPTPSGGQIPWDKLKTECWTTTGETLAPGTAIDSIGIVVPGDENTDRSFANMCLNGIAVY